MGPPNCRQTRTTSPASPLLRSILLPLRAVASAESRRVCAGHGASIIRVHSIVRSVVDGTPSRFAASSSEINPIDFMLRHAVSCLSANYIIVAGCLSVAANRLSKHRGEKDRQIVDSAADRYYILPSVGNIPGYREYHAFLADRLRGPIEAAVASLRVLVTVLELNHRQALRQLH